MSPAYHGENAYCAYRNCDRIFWLTTTHPGKIYCSLLCRQRERDRRDADKRRAGGMVPRPSRAKNPRPDLCEHAPCSSPMPETANVRARYCTPECKKAMAADRKREKHAQDPTPRQPVGRPPVKPRKEPEPVAPLVPKGPLADPCDGCRHVRPQPASFRGVECARGVFRACNPLGIEGPKLKEAI